MILKIASGLSKKQKYTIVGIVILSTFLLTLSYIVNQTNKNSQAAIILPLTGGATSSSISSSSKNITSSSSSVKSSENISSSVISSSSSSSEIPKPELIKTEEVRLEQIIEKIKEAPAPVIYETPKPIQPVYIPPVLEQPKPVIVETPKPVEVIQPPAPAVVEPQLSFSSNSCNQGMVYNLLSLLNNHRLANGAGPLTLAGDLNGVACSHAQWMSETGNFSHTGKDGTNPYQRCDRAGTVCWAENVAFDTELTAESIFELYKNSPGHNKNMLNPEYTEVGLAFAGVYNAQEFR